MDKEDRQKLADIERQVIEQKFGPTDDWPVTEIPDDIQNKYKAAEKAIQEYKEAALKSMKEQPGYAIDEFENLINMSEMSLEESLGWAVGD